MQTNTGAANVANAGGAVGGGAIPASQIRGRRLQQTGTGTRSGFTQGQGQAQAQPQAQAQAQPQAQAQAQTQGQGQGQDQGQGQQQQPSPSSSGGGELLPDMTAWGLPRSSASKRHGEAAPASPIIATEAAMRQLHSCCMHMLLMGQMPGQLGPWQ